MMKLITNWELSNFEWWVGYKLQAHRYSKFAQGEWKTAGVSPISQTLMFKIWNNIKMVYFGATSAIVALTLRTEVPNLKNPEGWYCLGRAKNEIHVLLVSANHSNGNFIITYLANVDRHRTAHIVWVLCLTVSPDSLLYVCRLRYSDSSLRRLSGSWDNSRSLSLLWLQEKYSTKRCTYLKKLSSSLAWRRYIIHTCNVRPICGRSIIIQNIVPFIITQG